MKRPNEPTRPGDKDADYTESEPGGSGDWDGFGWGGVDDDWSGPSEPMDL